MDPVIASLAIAGIIGCLLAIAVKMGVLLAFRLPEPWLSKKGLPPARPVPTDFRVPAFILGGATIALALFIAIATTETLGGYAGSVILAVYGVAAFWGAGALWHFGRLAIADRFLAVLGPGDPDYDYALALAEQGGVTLKTMWIVAKPDGFVRLANKGIIAITVSEREKLTEQERQVRLAEWIGTMRVNSDHSKPETAILALAFLPAVFLILLLGFHPSIGFSILISQIPLQIMIQVRTRTEARMKRKVDRFVLDTFNNYYLVSSAMAVYTDLASPSPQTPSRAVKERLDRLRKAADELSK